MTEPQYRVAIGIPYYRSVEGPTLLSSMDLAARSAEAQIAMLPIGTSGCYIEDNRNGSVQYALNTGIDALALLLPHLDRFTRGDWLVYHDGGVADLAGIAAQTAIYVALLAAAALFDLYRKPV